MGGANDIDIYIFMEQGIEVCIVSGPDKVSTFGSSIFIWFHNGSWLFSSHVVLVKFLLALKFSVARGSYICCTFAGHRLEQTGAWVYLEASAKDLLKGAFLLSLHEVPF